MFFWGYCFVSDDVVEKLWDLGDWEKLVLLYDYLKWWKYCEFLAQYYNQNSFKFLLDPDVVYRRVSNPPASLQHRMY